MNKLEREMEVGLVRGRGREGKGEWGWPSATPISLPPFLFLPPSSSFFVSLIVIFLVIVCVM
jgi:hypothetical protein